MKLNKKQKECLFQMVFSQADLMKIFDTTSIEWLVKQKVEIKDMDKGWAPLLLNGEEYTQINFGLNPGWLDTIENIDEYGKCDWCEEWFGRDDLVRPNKHWTLCERCYDYLVSREGPFHR